MSSKKYYWLKLQEHFFDDDKMIFFESLENGERYIVIWIKLLLKCLKDKEDGEYGFLRFSDKIPYDDQLLSKVLRCDIDHLRVALKYFQEHGMIEILDDNTIYIECVQKMIGRETDSAERMRLHRKRKKELECNNVTQGDVTSYNNKDININIDKDINIDKKKDKHKKEEDLFTFWNSLKNVIHHRNIDSHLDNITKQLKKGHNKDIEAVKNAMRVYDEVLGSDKVFFGYHHKWVLVDFLSRGVPKYLDKSLEDFYDSKYANKVDVAKNGFGYNEVL